MFKVEPPYCSPYIALISLDIYKHLQTSINIFKSPMVLPFFPWWVALEELLGKPLGDVLVLGSRGGADAMARLMRKSRGWELWELYGGFHIPKWMVYKGNPIEIWMMTGGTPISGNLQLSHLFQSQGTFQGMLKFRSNLGNCLGT